jgi:RNA polymerase sigma factor (sigma-70 family)
MSQANIIKTFGEYKERLYFFVRKYLIVKDDAEDIVQEVFYQLSRMNNLAKPVEQTAAWLFRVAKNMIINRTKKKSAIPFSVLINNYGDDEEDLSDFTGLLSSNNITPEIELLRKIVWEEIEVALDELPALQRDVFIKTELWGLSVKEISKKTNIPVNTLLSRKHYAVKYLRKRLLGLYQDIIKLS